MPYPHAEDIDAVTISQLRADLTPADLREVLTAFEQDVARLAAALAAAAQAGDATAFIRSAHALAGASGAVGAVALERLSRQAMQQCRPDPVAAFALADAIQALAGSAVQTLHRMVTAQADQA